MPNNLDVVVNRVNYVKATNNSRWMILATDMGTAKGVGGWEPVQGERLVLHGDWAVYNGQKEFSFVSMSPAIPTSSRGLLRYICEITPGFGEGIERRIWDAYGENWVDRANNLDVSGVSESKQASFSSTMEYLARNKKECEMMAWLVSKGLTTKQASKTYELFADKTVTVLNENCYSLTEVSGIGFIKVDSDIRKNFDISDDDPRRVEAGIIYAMRDHMNGGTACHWEELADAIVCKTLRNLSKEKAIDAMAKMIKDGKIVAFVKSEMLALRSDYENEKSIWEYCNA